MEKKNFKQRVKDLWNYFSLYEKIWFFVILVLAIVFTLIFPETGEYTYSVNVNKSCYNSSSTGTYNKLDFSGTEGEYTIVGITINDETFSIEDFTKYAEFTVKEGDSETYILNLPENKSLTKDDTISIECYQDSDEGTLKIALVGDTDSLFTIDVSLDENTNSYSVTENVPNYIFSGGNPTRQGYERVLKWITIFYLLDVILNVSCELLISKQSKWNFIVSLGVEVVEIIVCVLCMYRFATMATTLLFWIPCDIISFVMWHRHPDKEQEELTVVKKLTPWQDVIIIFAIIVWTIGVGYLLTLIEVDGGIFANNVMLKNITCYIDACVSAVGIANGLLILFRYREQWLAWYISAILETVINIMAGQWVLLVLKAGYLTNTTYGYIKWTQYIKHAKENAEKEATDNSTEKLDNESTNEQVDIDTKSSDNNIDGKIDSDSNN